LEPNTGASRNDAPRSAKRRVLPQAEVGVDRAHVHHRLAGLHVRQNAVLAEHRGLDGLVVAEAVEHQVGAAHGLADRAGDLGAVLAHGVGPLGRAVPGGHLVAGADEVRHHAASHDADAQVGDLVVAHVSSLFDAMASKMIDAGLAAGVDEALGALPHPAGAADTAAQRGHGVAASARRVEHAPRGGDDVRALLHRGGEGLRGRVQHVDDGLVPGLRLAALLDASVRRRQHAGQVRSIHLVLAAHLLARTHRRGRQQRSQTRRRRPVAARRRASAPDDRAALQLVVQAHQGDRRAGHLHRGGVFADVGPIDLHALAGQDLVGLAEDDVQLLRRRGPRPLTITPRGRQRPAQVVQGRPSCAR
jgi:hypothetical protein